VENLLRYKEKQDPDKIRFYKKSLGERGEENQEKGELVES